VKKRLIVLGVMVVGALAFAMWMSDDGGASEPGLVLDRLWIDQLPKAPKDTFNVFAAVSKEKIGVFQSGSQWKGSYEFFSHDAGDGALRILYLQTGDKEKVKTRAWRCKERGMDYCLELKGSSRGVKRYRSQVGWEIGESTRVEQLRGRIESMARPTN
jgi:hypothetical protein